MKPMNNIGRYKVEFEDIYQKGAAARAVLAVGGAVDCNVQHHKVNTRTGNVSLCVEFSFDGFQKNMSMSSACSGSGCDYWHTSLRNHIELTPEEFMFLLFREYNHTIIIDGIFVELSEESFQALKKQLNSLEEN